MYIFMVKMKNRRPISVRMKKTSRDASQLIKYEYVFFLNFYSKFHRPLIGCSEKSV